MPQVRTKARLQPGRIHERESMGLHSTLFSDHAWQEIADELLQHQRRHRNQRPDLWESTARYLKDPDRLLITDGNTEEELRLVAVEAKISPNNFRSGSGRRQAIEVPMLLEEAIDTLRANPEMAQALFPEAPPGFFGTVIYDPHDPEFNRAVVPLTNGHFDYAAERDGVLRVTDLDGEPASTWGIELYNHVHEELFQMDTGDIRSLTTDL